MGWQPMGEVCANTRPAGGQPIAAIRYRRCLLISVDPLLMGRIVPLKQAAPIVDRHWTTLARWARKGEITTYRVGGRVYVDPQLLMSEVVRERPRDDQ